MVHYYSYKDTVFFWSSEFLSRQNRTNIKGVIHIFNFSSPTTVVTRDHIFSPS